MKKTKFNVFLLFLFLSLFLVSIYFDNKSVEEFNRNSIQITKEDSLNIKVHRFYIDHGTLIFNEKYVITINQLNRDNIEFLDDWYDLPDTFILKKKINNDTLWFQFSGFYEYTLLIPKKD